MGECWRGCFAWKEMLCSWVIPGRGRRILGRLGPSDPSLVLPQASSSLPLIYTMFPKGLLAGALDATPPGRSCQIMTKSWPPTRKLAPCGTREGLLSGRWRLTIGWCWKRQTGVGLSPINCLKLDQRPPEEAWHLHMCVTAGTHTPKAGWVGLLFTETTGNITAVNISAFWLFVSVFLV